MLPIHYLAIVSQPKQYAALISAMRTCLSHIENILETHSPVSPLNRISPNTTNSDHSSVTTAATATVIGHNKAPPPPLPPKPSRIQKPSIPPKPSLSKTSRPTSPTKELHDSPHLLHQGIQLNILFYFFLYVAIYM